jgi:hypothetical protein
MPVKQFTRRPPPPDAATLRDRLAREWQQPDPSAQQPIILEESCRPNLPEHVYVVWDDWKNMRAEDRAEIIMDAYEERYGKDKVVNVTVALGLTPAEADRMGIQYR